MAEKRKPRRPDEEWDDGTEEADRLDDEDEEWDDEDDEGEEWDDDEDWDDDDEDGGEIEDDAVCGYCQRSLHPHFGDDEEGILPDPVECEQCRIFFCSEDCLEQHRDSEHAVGPQD